MVAEFWFAVFLAVGNAAISNSVTRNQQGSSWHDAESRVHHPGRWHVGAFIQCLRRMEWVCAIHAYDILFSWTQHSFGFLRFCSWSVISDSEILREALSSNVETIKQGKHCRAPKTWLRTTKRELARGNRSAHLKLRTLRLRMAVLNYWLACGNTNNYSEEYGRPVVAKFFNRQPCIYSSPAVVLKEVRRILESIPLCFRFWCTDFSFCSSSLPRFALWWSVQAEGELIWVGKHTRTRARTERVVDLLPAVVLYAHHVTSAVRPKVRKLFEYR